MTVKTQYLLKISRKTKMKPLPKLVACGLKAGYYSILHEHNCYCMKLNTHMFNPICSSKAGSSVINSTLPTWIEHKFCIIISFLFEKTSFQQRKNIGEHCAPKVNT